MYHAPAPRPAPPPYRPPPSFRPSCHSSPVCGPRLAAPPPPPLPPKQLQLEAAAPLLTEAALVRSLAARLQQNLGHLEHGPHTVLLPGGRVPRPGRGRVVVRGLATAPRLEAVRQLVRGRGEEEWVAVYLVSAVQVLYTLCPSLQCSVLAGDQLLLRCCLRGGEDTEASEDSEDSLHRQHPGLALAQLDMDTLTAAPEHAELVAGLRSLHVAAEDILRAVAASAQLLSAPSPAPALAPLLGLPGARLARCVAEHGAEGAVWRSLATSLKLRTLQSLVKKVNRTLARHAALRRLGGGGGGGGQLEQLEVEDTPPHLARRGPAPDLLTRRPPPLPADIRELFSPSLCTFGFAAHLFAQETDSSISAPPPPPPPASSTVFCLAGDLALVEQVWRLDTLYCTALHCTVLYCAVLCCTVLHCTVLQVRRLDMLELLLGDQDQLWQCWTQGQLIARYR